MYEIKVLWNLLVWIVLVILVLIAALFLAALLYKIINIIFTEVINVISKKE